MASPPISSNDLEKRMDSEFLFEHIWVFPKIGGKPPQMDGLQWKTLLKSMIWGYPYFCKHPYISLYVFSEFLYVSFFNRFKLYLFLIFLFLCSFYLNI